MVAAFLVGVVFLGLAVALLARGFGLGTRKGELVDQISEYGFDATLPGDGQTLGRRLRASDAAAALGEVLARMRKGAEESEIRRKLIAAGIYTTSPRQFVGYQVITAIGLFLLWGAMGWVVEGNRVIYVVLLVLAPLLGWYLPSIVLDRRIKSRLDEIDRGMPELIDLLVVSVEAGVGFVQSLRLVSQQVEGPLARELRLAVQEQSMGLTATEAIEGILKRVDTRGVRMFVRAVVQGETLGVSIGQVLRNLADELRKRRKAVAEEKAQKAPVKMLFPLIFLIFPGMFVVLLLPAIISISRALGS
jgi:tight adherence protein C